MRIKEVDKDIDLWYNSITETVAGAIGGFAMPIGQKPLKRPWPYSKMKTSKKKKKKDA
jgi:hypothetical protein